MKRSFELRNSSLRIGRGEESSKGVSDVVVPFQLKTCRQCLWQKNRKGKGVLSCRYSALKLNQGQQLLVGVFEVIVVNIILRPINFLTAMDAQAQLGVGPVCLAVHVHRPFNCLPRVVETLAKGDVYEKKRVFVLG